MRVIYQTALSVIVVFFIVSEGLFAQSHAATAYDNFTIQGKIETPDGVLIQGDYSIRIFDHLADRMIIEIQGRNGEVDQKFLGVPAKHLPNSQAAGLSLAVGVKGESAMRGFAFSNGSRVEFVYLKNDAVALAKANGSAVLAVDPSGEGMIATKNLSPEDMKIVTLWLLTPNRVGPNNQKASVQAEKYHVSETKSTLIADAQTPSAINGAVIEAPRSKFSPIARLPKTASDLPLLMLLAVGLFAAAISIRLYNFRF